MYHAEHNASGGVGTRAIISFKTPNTTKWAHAVFEVRSNGEAIYQLQEAASMGTGTGASFAPRNHDRNSTKTTTLKNTSLGTDGTAGYVTVGCDYSGSTLTLFSTKIGDGREGGETRGHDEWILKQDTVYAVMVTSQAASSVVRVNMTYYEHTNKTA